jgi:hypothetical protein
MYLQGLILCFILVLLTLRFKKELPTPIQNNIKLVCVSYFLITLLILGAPVRLESTAISGKESFQTVPQVTPKVTTGTPELTLDEELLLMKQQSKEIKDEIK